MTTIGLIRHGVTDWNAQRRVQGQTDIPLNEEGRRQARALAQRIREEQWDLIYSSDLARAAETAEIVANLNKIQVTLDPRLREVNNGLIEGTTEEERILKWGTDWRALNLGKETEEGIHARGASFFRELVTKHPQQKVLIVSHGAFIVQTLRRIVPDLNMESLLHNSSVTLLNLNNEQWNCELYNCIKHL